MWLPKLNMPAQSRQMMDTFGGYNHNLRIGDGEFYDMKNLTSDFYPLLAPREKRGIYTQASGCTGMVAKDALCYTRGKFFVINGKEIDLGLTDERKQLISMGAFVVILPDKKYINTADLSDYGSLENAVTTQAAATFTLCKEDGTAYTPKYTQAGEPEAPENMDIWLDTGSTPVSLKQWSESSGMWVTITSTYIRIDCPGIGAGFSQYDGVKISGLKGAELKDENGNVIHSAELEELDGSFVLWGQGNDYIVVVGLLSGTRTVTNHITVQRKMPKLDYVTECGNRLWGCYYGLNEEGTQVVNELYCSKLGDFKNWYCYMGISTDSWAASVGSDGQWTGAATVQGYPFFFKENVLHQIYPSDSGAHQVREMAVPGVEAGSHQSLAIVGTTLYYKSNRGICSFGGATPNVVSQQLGNVRYRNGRAGALGSKYYICMDDDAGKPHVFVLDTEKGLWHREDSTDMAFFCHCRGKLYFLDSGDGCIKTVTDNGNPEPAPVESMAQSGLIGLSLPDAKYISRLVLRLSLPIGSTMSGYARYDSEGPWEHLFTLDGCGTKSFLMPIRVVRCDHMELRLEGVGHFTLYSITKTIEQGSDIP